VLVGCGGWLGLSCGFPFGCFLGFLLFLFNSRWCLHAVVRPRNGRILVPDLESRTLGTTGAASNEEEEGN